MAARNASAAKASPNKRGAPYYREFGGQKIRDPGDAEQGVGTACDKTEDAEQGVGTARDKTETPRLNPNRT